MIAESPMAHVAHTDYYGCHITDGQRRAWRREIAARFDGDARAEMLAMVLGEGA